MHHPMMKTFVKWNGLPHYQTERYMQNRLEDIYFLFTLNHRWRLRAAKTVAGRGLKSERPRSHVLLYPQFCNTANAKPESTLSGGCQTTFIPV